VDALWSRTALIFASSLILATVAVAVISRLPNRFRSETLILIVPPSVPQEYVRATVNIQVKDRLSSLNQQILSRTRLEKIIRDFHLYATERSKPMEAIVELMRKNIQVEVVPGSEAFRVSYDASDPNVAMRVTERLAGLFIEENTRDREALAHATSSFLEDQLEDARTHLVDQEKRLEAYRLRHGPELPTQLQSNMQAIQSTQSQIQSIEESVNRDRDRQLLMERQVADLEAEQLLEPASPDVPGQQTSALAAQLEKETAELSALQLRFSPQHPDVVHQKQVVADLEQKVRDQAAAAGASPAPRARPLTATEQMKRSRVRDLKAELDTLGRQINKKLADQAELRATLQTYRSRVEALPTRESELAALTRDYDTMQTLYRGLLAKKEDSKVAENLEQHQIGEQFKIIDPPRRPQRPISPNRRLLYAGGAAAAVVLSLVLAALLEFLDKTLRTEADVQAALGAPILVVIPRMMTDRERRRSMVRRLATSLALAATSAACGAIMWLTFKT
jgi:polysaccharide chain length determinant protein (PEP-CTERM system associated)